MEIKKINGEFSVCSQIQLPDLSDIARLGYRSVICNRPDGESVDQPTYSEVEQAARQCSLEIRNLPAVSGQVTDEQGVAFGLLLDELPKPVLAYCRTGMRSITMWALSQAPHQTAPQLLETAAQAGYDLKGVVRRIVNGGKTPIEISDARHEIVIVGGGAAGISVAASLLARQPGLDIAIIDPAETHFYQPGWTMVGGGIFDARTTARPMGSLIPRGVRWINSAVVAFEPEQNALVLEGCRVIKYQQLVVCPGLKLDWDAIPGLTDTLGRNGVTSNYRYDLAPYTWERVQQLRGGEALFTQPPMPIKCAGAPQKAMYLSADHWRRTGVLKDIQIDFFNAGAVLFGVADYVPALMEYVNRYSIHLNFSHTLSEIDGDRRSATFIKTLPDGTKEIVVKTFDMIHVVPPQKAPDFVRASPLADAAGWVEVDPITLRHKRFENIYGLGDACNTTNAKTAAAARKQAPVVAHNVLAARGQLKGTAQYDGYGSCPLTVERGKIVLAEFLYGGKVAPSFPKWLIDGTRPSRLAWLLKERMLPPLYWQGMLKGREWLAEPELRN